MLWQGGKRELSKNFFPLPSEIFSLRLSPGALAVYSYLLYCEDRKTYQCYPSYTSIGKSVSMSVNTVRKYVAEFEEQGLVVTEPTSIMTKDGRRRNGSLRYTILPIQNAVDLHNQRQLRQLEETTEQMRVAKKLETPRVSACKPLCTMLPSGAGRKAPESVLHRNTAVYEGTKEKQDKGQTPQAAPGQMTSARSAGS